MPKKDSPSADEVLEKTDLFLTDHVRRSITLQTNGEGLLLVTVVRPEGKFVVKALPSVTLKTALERVLERVEYL